MPGERLGAIIIRNITISDFFGRGTLGKKRKTILGGLIPSDVDLPKLLLLTTLFFF